MHDEIASKRDDLIGLCQRHGVERLEIFGSAARGMDFDPATSDADFLVEFKLESRIPLEHLLGFADALEHLLGRPVDLIERRALEASRNYIRRRRILAEAEPVYG